VKRIVPVALLLAAGAAGAEPHEVMALSH